VTSASFAPDLGRPRPPRPRRMIACLDVDYQKTMAMAAGLAFRDWPDASPAAQCVVPVSAIRPYESGGFFKRKLPCLLAVLRKLPAVKVIVVDGYVWLDDAGMPGLGAMPLKRHWRRS
jgi:deoxyribonuclease V